jgi:hypothetical protein
VELGTEAALGITKEDIERKFVEAYNEVQKNRDALHGCVE